MIETQATYINIDIVQLHTSLFSAIDIHANISLLLARYLTHFATDPVLSHRQDLDQVLTPVSTLVLVVLHLAGHTMSLHQLDRRISVKNQSHPRPMAVSRTRHAT
jgi:hypothetical protein